MPIIVTSLPEGHTPPQKTALLHRTAQAVVDSLGAPMSNVRIVLQERPAGHSLIAGQEDAPFVLFVVYLIEGRSPDMKAALIAALNAAATDALGLPDNATRIMIHDMLRTDMGVAGGVSALAAGR